MNARERVIRAITFQSPDRIPVAEHFWEDTLANWRKEGLPEDASPDDFFDFDITHLGIDSSPRFTPELLEDDGEWITLRDRFGYVVKKRKGVSRTLDYLSYPIADRDTWENVRPMFAMDDDTGARIDDTAFPFRLGPDPSWDEARAMFKRQQAKERYLLATAYGPHEAVWRMRGFTETLMDLALDPGFIAEIARTYTEFLVSVIDRCVAEGVVPDGFMAIEDIAATRGMLFSPDTWRNVYLPEMRRLGDYLNRRGIHFWMHCCGNASAVFPDLIDCGLGVINPLEAKSGLDVTALKRRYGNKLAYYGNIDIAVMSGPEGILETEIKEKLAAFSDGGYIAHSDHSVPPEVSFERYCKILEMIRTYGVFDA